MLNRPAHAAVGRERVHLRERRGGRRHLHRDPLRHRVEPAERVGQRHRPAEDLGADPVGLELPLARDGELDQHRADRREQQQRELRDRVAVVVAPPAAEQEQVGQVADRAGDAGGERGDQHVAVLDVRQLVRDHALELLLRHVLEDAGRDRDDRVVGVPPGGERVGLLVRRHRDDRHRQSRPLAEPVDHPVELGRLLLGDDLRAVHPEHDLIREEVHDEVERAAQDQGEHEPLRPPEQLAGEQEQAQKAGHQDHGLDVVHALLCSTLLVSGV